MPHPELDAEALYTVLAKQVKDALASVDNVALVGIYSGGAWLADRLAAELQLAGRLGYIDVSFYRDDFASKGLKAGARRSDLPFDVGGASIVLIDDVLYTGRSTRAAINELFDYGRPASIELAVLIDRGGRELPIEPTYVGARVACARSLSIVLSRAISRRPDRSRRHLHFKQRSL